MKKKLVIFAFIILFLIIFIIFGVLIKNVVTDLKNEEPNEISIQVAEKEVSIFNVSNDENETEKENFQVKETDELIGDISIKIGDTIIEDNLGTNLILKQNYCHLKDEYYLLEMLIAKKEGLEYKTDAELSMSYDYCKLYGKVWYLYNDNTKEKYIFEDNTNTAQLSLNPILSEDELNTYFEFDKMFYFGGNTDVDHYRISLDNLIALAQSNNIIDFSIYSSINCPDFNKNSLVDSITAEEDLNLDGKKDSICLELFDDYSDYNKIGFRLSINNSFIELKNCNTVSAINIIDLDKKDKFKEILIISSSEEESYVQDWKIFSYDGTNILLIFNQSVEENGIEYFSKVNYIDTLTLDDEGFLRLKTIISDTVQNWEVVKKFALNENHILYEIVPEFYLNQKEQKIISKEEIVLYDKMSSDSVSDKVIHQGQEVVLEGTTLNYWFVISIDGQNYFIPLENNGKIKDLGYFPFQVFSKLEATD